MTEVVHRILERQQRPMSKKHSSRKSPSHLRHSQTLNTLTGPASHRKDQFTLTLLPRATLQY